MKILVITPTFFGDASVVGGAERYAWELSKALAARADVTVVTFGDTPGVERRDGLTLRTLRRRRLVDHPLAASPLSAGFLSAIAHADVVHCHQVDTFATSAALVAGRLLGKRVFVSDLGGGHVYAPTNYAPLLRWADGMLLISEYSREQWRTQPASHRPGRPGTSERLHVIHGGVDIRRFSPGGERDPDMVLYVGRIVPHKGIEHLIDAVTAPMRLHIVGRPYDAGYLEALRARAAGKAVVFEHDVDDDGLVARYRRAFVSVLPSASVDFRGRITAVAELFGLVVVEAMACATPVIVSRTTSLPELVDDGVTGWIVPPADPAALRARLLALHGDAALGARVGAAARAVVEQRFTWPATADRVMAVFLAPRGGAPGATT